ncbi:MAG: sigma-70 family RNA polymerase sigma factor, partial [Prevotella conceptionensis]
MNVTQLNDNALVALAAEQHNRKAFNELVVRYQSPIRRFFLNQTLGNEPLSDDLAQDTFVKAYLNITKFRGDSAFSTWLYRIAYNVFYDHVRSNKHTEDLETTEVARRNAEVSDTTVSLDIYEALNRLS